jgi:hypothetical protein
MPKAAAGNVKASGWLVKISIAKAGSFFGGGFAIRLK